jgi:hypothetical protein
MRRFIALLILLVLPLQWSYAAVADYCLHEEVVDGQNHVDYHGHDHLHKAPEAKDLKSSCGDTDCSSIHHHHSAPVAMFESPKVFSAPDFSTAPIIFLSHSIPHRSPDNPFRPPLAIRL